MTSNAPSPRRRPSSETGILASSAGPIAPSTLASIDFRVLARGAPAFLGGPGDGDRRTTHVGLFAIAAGCSALAALPATLAGYIAPIVIVTAGYALFQTATTPTS